MSFVAIENAISPNTKIPNVSAAKNLSADSFEPTVKPVLSSAWLRSR